MRAEDYFLEAWHEGEEPPKSDRDFSRHEEAQEVYGAEEVEDVEHFSYPETDPDTDFVYAEQNLPLELFADRYREHLEDETLDLSERFERSIEYAEENGCSKEAEILEDTLEQLQES